MVYLVDDDIEDLEITEEALVYNSYKGPVITLQNGKVLMEQLHQSASKKPDVIVLDLNMPIKDGFETLNEIKSNSKLKNIPVIVLTASTNMADKVRCAELGCNLFYTKPNSLKDYDSIVKQVKAFVNIKKV